MRTLALLACFSLTSCAYNSTTITAHGNVTCYSSVDKPVNIRALDENTVPLSGL